jgi:hypothetical protein
MLAPEEDTVHFTVGAYLKYHAIDRLVQRQLGSVEHYQLLFADPQRLDCVVDLAVPKQHCTWGEVRADGVSLAREAQQMARYGLVAIGSLHKHGINCLSQTDVQLLDENLAREMAPALLRPFEVRVEHPEARFELSGAAEVAIDGQTLPVESANGKRPQVVLRKAHAIRTGYRARVFCLATNGGPRPRFHGQQVIVIRIPECPSAHSYRCPIRAVALVPGEARLPLDEPALEAELLDKLTAAAYYCYGGQSGGWRSKKAY